MIDALWGVMIIAGFMTAIATGKVVGLTDAVLSGGKDAVELSIAMLGVVPLWCGVMRIGERAGIVNGIRTLFMPVLRILFPDVPEKSRAMECIATNLAANFLGLGWAATPAGIMAMKELKKENGGKNKASRSMCMFLIINMSSVQLVSMNLIAYRSRFGSVSPADVTVPIIIATCASTAAGIIYAKIMEKRDKG